MSETPERKSGEALASARFSGIVVQAGTDSETGKPRITIETDEQQLRDIRANLLFKPCRVEIIERCPVLPMTKDKAVEIVSMPLPAADGSEIPSALFSCSNEYCGAEVSYHADQLYWYAAEKRWVCENCWGDLPGPTDEDDRPCRGVTLAEHIKAVALLQNAALCEQK